MKISEAAREAGVTTATWKYYIREGLVPEGERLGANRTEYGEAHVRRVRLVRALLDTGRLSISSAREVLDALDSHVDIRPAFEAAQHALDEGRPPGTAESTARVEKLVTAQGWLTTGRNPGVDAAARALDGFAATGQQPSDAYLAAYADAARRLAQADLAAIAELAARDGSDSVVELMVVGTVMGDGLIAGLRRIAQEHESAHAAETTASGATDSALPNSASRKDTP